MSQSPASVPPAVLGILYAEDFDEPSSASQSAPEPEPEPAEPVFTQADIDNASASAVEAARRRWATENDQRRTDTLAALAAALSDARNAAEQTSMTIAESAVQTMLSMLSGLLPHFSAEHGSAEVRALVNKLLPTLRAEPQITVRVHADLVKQLEHDIAQLAADLAGTVNVVSAPLEHGDVKVTWHAGSLTRDTRKIMQAMQDALSQLGLQLPTETTPKRKLAYAE